MARKRPIPQLPEDDAPEDRSRSQKKRESAAMQQLGEELSAKPLAVVRGMDLPGDLLEALEELHAMGSREARRRQLQYIGRLMREADWRAIAAQLESLAAPSRAETARFHRLERLRDSLLDAAHSADMPAKLAALAAEWPHMAPALNEIRHLAEAALAEKNAAKPPKSARALFRLLRDLDSTREQGAHQSTDNSA